MSNRYDTARAVIETKTAEMLEGHLIDVQTASLLVRVYEALSEERRITFDTLPLPRLIDICWKTVSRG